ncbi:MAG: hypothetical protein CM1200mP10_15630 [Candidatus Neomarinimicrobiota bacterium]|nr:MAG: hypothetical protein CM1200mP10_15630 [Candidatus Neomarinimicrobiota bacterium]
MITFVLVFALLGYTISITLLKNNAKIFFLQKKFSLFGAEIFVAMAWNIYNIFPNTPMVPDQHWAQKIFYMQSHCVDRIFILFHCYGSRNIIFD